MIDGDSVCMILMKFGCTDGLACNYDATPTTDTNNACIYRLI